MVKYLLRRSKVALAPPRLQLATAAAGLRAVCPGTYRTHGPAPRRAHRSGPHNIPVNRSQYRPLRSFSHEAHYIHHRRKHIYLSSHIRRRQCSLLLNFCRCEKFQNQPHAFQAASESQKAPYKHIRPNGDCRLQVIPSYFIPPVCFTAPSLGILSVFFLLRPAPASSTPERRCCITLQQY